MNTKKRWQEYLNELVSASLDPAVYAVQWARHPSCLQSGASHRRVGRVNLDSPVCALWSAASKRVWQ